MKAPLENGGDSDKMWDMWLKEVIFSTNCWLEVPMHMEGYHLYYRDCVKLVRKDILYLLVVGIISMAALTVPIILLFIFCNCLKVNFIYGGRFWKGAVVLI